MYEYKFVKVDLSKWSMTSKPKEDYHEIIHEHAREGWKLLQVFAPPIQAYGTAAFFDLIFEREKS
ncbi:MAG: DUF4177 domain-containing protein [Clostridiaceae bacterium]|nr:DUF4177 domain-containing protein [Clostridiaceae bacterium]